MRGCCLYTQLGLQHTDLLGWLANVDLALRAMLCAVLCPTVLCRAMWHVQCGKGLDVGPLLDLVASGLVGFMPEDGLASRLITMFSCGFK